MKKLVIITFLLSLSVLAFSQQVINIQVISKGTYNKFKKTWTWGEPKTTTGFSVTISKDYVRFNSKTKDENGKYTETFIVISSDVPERLHDKTISWFVLHNNKGEKLSMGLCDYKSEEVMDEILALTGDTGIKYFVIF